MKLRNTVQNECIEIVLFSIKEKHVKFIWIRNRKYKII